MRTTLFVLLLLNAWYRAAAQAPTPITARQDKVSLTFAVGPDGYPTYALSYGPKPYQLLAPGPVFRRWQGL